MKGILFDLDGTLVDTLEDIRAALNHVMALCWCREISASECRAVVGNGLRKALIGALWYSRAAYPEDELDILYRELVDFYSANACVHSRVYDGIPQLLDEAKGRGCMLGVLSNKADSLVRRSLDAFFRDASTSCVVLWRERGPNLTKKVWRTSLSFARPPVRMLQWWATARSTGRLPGTQV